MSIAGTITTLERANAAVTAAQPGAKRGMLALVERRNSYMSLRDGHHAWTTYTPAIVTSVSRDGLAKEVQLAGQSWPLKARDWRQITIDSRQQIAYPERVAAALVDENGHAIEYRDQAEAVAAIKAAAGIEQEPQVVPKIEIVETVAPARARQTAAHLRLVETAPTSENETVKRPAPPRRRPNLETRAREYLEWSEVQRLMAATKGGRYGHRDATLLLIGFRHGLRCNELCGLLWRDVDLDRATIMCRRLKHGEDGAHPLQGDELRALRRLRREAGDARFVFMGERGAPLTDMAVRKMMSRLSVKAGLGWPAHPHCLRHGAGKALADQGFDIRFIAAYLGHRALSSTQLRRGIGPALRRHKMAILIAAIVAAGWLRRGRYVWRALHTPEGRQAVREDPVLALVMIFAMVISGERRPWHARLLRAARFAREFAASE